MGFKIFAVISCWIVGQLITHAAGKTTLRIGHFPNVTHAQALVAHNLSRQQKGWFEQRLGPNVEVHWFTYNAGPAAMEAFFANSLDVTYVGPNPALNAYFRSQGEEVRVIAGAALGGSALVIHPGSGIKAPADFRGKRIATPQFGNTQDVSCRVWLQRHGLRITAAGGDAHVVPTANPDQLLLFQRQAIAGVWTVEPWVSRLELETGGKIFLEETNAITTILVARRTFLEKNRELVKKLAAAHGELTRWINEHPQEAQALVKAELQTETRREFSDALLQRAWSRLTFSTNVSEAAFQDLVKSAQQVGFLKQAVPLQRLVEVP